MIDCSSWSYLKIVKFSSWRCIKAPSLVKKYVCSSCNNFILEGSCQLIKIFIWWILWRITIFLSELWFKFSNWRIIEIMPFIQNWIKTFGCVMTSWQIARMIYDSIQIINQILFLIGHKRTHIQPSNWKLDQIFIFSSIFESLQRKN